MDRSQEEEERRALRDMEVIVHSTLPSVGGRVTVATDPGQTVDSLITAFCIEKGIQHRKRYILRNGDHDVLENTKTLAASDVHNGEVLFITSKEISDDWPCGCNQWWLMAGVALLIGCTGIVAVCIIQVKGHVQPVGYGVVVDAGSSHSSVFVYQWPGEKSNGTGLVAETDKCKTSPGISNYTDDPEKAGKSLEKCLEQGESSVPSSEHRTTSVHLGATAGMRLLEASDNKTCEEILTSVRTTLSSTPFNFTQPNKQARILTGSEEGVFSWVTVNYLAGMFGTIPGTDLLLTYVLGAGESPQTQGALDMGGASTQISFIPADPGQVLPDYSMTFTLYGRQYDVYTHSYLCYGMNEAYTQLQAQLVANQAPNTNITNPCGPDGNVSSVTHSHIFEVPCTQGKFPTSHLDVDANTTYNFIGTSDPDLCSDVVNGLFNTSVPCEHDNCTFDGVYQPALNGEYKAFSNFYTIMKFFNSTGNDTTLTEFRETRHAFCEKSWDEIKHMKEKPKFLVKECFSGYFIDQLLTLYGFNEDNWHTLHFVDKVADTTVGWSLGFMLVATDAIPAEFASDPLSIAVFILLLALFILFILFAVAFACCARRSTKKTGNYQRLSTYGTV